MSKIPVGRTIAAAYEFTFGNLRRVFGIAWFSLLLTLAGGLAIAVLSIRMANQAAGLTGGDLAASGQLGRLNGFVMLVAIVQFIVRSMLIYGLTEEALTPAVQPPYFYFSLSGRVWTLVLGYFLLALILLGICIALALGISVTAIGVAVAAQGNPSAHAVALLILCAVAVFVFAISLLLYFMLRFGFLMAPIAVAERDIGISRGWTMMRGNFWRAVAVCLAISLPLIAFSGLLTFLLYGNALLPPVDMLTHPGDSKQMGEEFGNALRAWGMQLRARSFQMLPISLPIGFVMSGLFYGLVAGASAFAYRALAPAQPRCSSALN